MKYSKPSIGLESTVAFVTHLGAKLHIEIDLDAVVACDLNWLRANGLGQFSKRAVVEFPEPRQLSCNVGSWHRRDRD